MLWPTFSPFSERGHNPKYDSCASFTVRALAPALHCKVTLTYNDTTLDRQLKASIHISSHRNLEVVHPAADKKQEMPTILLPVGSKSKAVFKGGATAWMGKPSGHYHKSE